MKGKEYIKERKRLLRMEIDRNRRLWKHHAGRSDIIFFSSSESTAAAAFSSCSAMCAVFKRIKSIQYDLIKRKSVCRFTWDV